VAPPARCPTGVRGRPREEDGVNEGWAWARVDRCKFDDFKTTSYGPKKKQKYSSESINHKEQTET
jgi:hypothetical protein